LAIQKRRLDGRLISGLVTIDAAYLALGHRSNASGAWLP